MVMENKFFNKSANILNALMVAVLLNSCTNGMNGMHKVHNSMNGVDKENHKELITKANDTQEACPNCKEGSRFLYKLADKNKSIILLCEECSSVWISPKNIGWGETVGDEKLESKFGVKDAEELFDENYSDWATQADIMKSEWKGFETTLAK